MDQVTCSNDEINCSKKGKYTTLYIYSSDNRHFRYMKKFYNYLKTIRGEGRISFTKNEALNELNVSESSVKSAVYRLKKQQELISPAKGLYVIVPPEYQSQGCIPAEELVPILMQHLNTKYYVSLLTAAKHYGASHQRSPRFQIITSKQINRKLLFGKVYIDTVYKKSFIDLPIEQKVVKTGYLNIASSELTALDLLAYSDKSGGLNHIATVLSELVEAMNPEKLIELADKSKQKVYFQRMGYILEQVDSMNEEAKDIILAQLKLYISKQKLKYRPLVPEIPITGKQYCRKWMIIENAIVESDL